MSDEKKNVLRIALQLALRVSKATDNEFDDIVVDAAVRILNRVFNLGLEM